MARRTATPLLSNLAASLDHFPILILVPSSADSCSHFRFLRARLDRFLGICKCCASHWPIGMQRKMRRLLLLSQWPQKDESMARICYGHASCHCAARNCNGCPLKNLLAAFWKNARILGMHVSKPMCVRCEIEHPAQEQEPDRLYPASKIWYQICLIPRDKVPDRPCF